MIIYILHRALLFPRQPELWLRPFTGRRQAHPDGIGIGNQENECGDAQYAKNNSAGVAVAFRTFDLEAGHILVAVKLPAGTQAIGVHDGDTKFCRAFIQHFHMHQAAVIDTAARRILHGALDADRLQCRTCGEIKDQ
jgi:hypothetical protein